VGGQAARREPPDEPEPVGFEPVPEEPGRTGVTVGYWNLWVMVVL
jgi:hypothetical protein